MSINYENKLWNQGINFDGQSLQTWTWTVLIKTFEDITDSPSELIYKIH